MPADAVQKTIAVYVDGYNLYDRITTAVGVPKDKSKDADPKKRLLWIRLDKLAAYCLVQKGEASADKMDDEAFLQNVRVNFYTARPEMKGMQNPRYSRREYREWTNLQKQLGHHVIEGYFKQDGRGRWFKEKCTDVNLAVDMISDADWHSHEIDVAILISDDRDFKRVVDYFHHFRQARKLYVLSVAKPVVAMGKEQVVAQEDAGWFRGNDKKVLKDRYALDNAQADEFIHQLNEKFCIITKQDIFRYCLECDEINFANGQRTVKCGNSKIVGIEQAWLPLAKHLEVFDLSDDFADRLASRQVG